MHWQDYGMKGGGGRRRVTDRRCVTEVVTVTKIAELLAMQYQQKLTEKVENKNAMLVYTVP